ncbi:phospholipase D family protein [Amphritea sp. HPY]|uniref:phospholipase D family protein n=1 Tax=Amphritea sp. HPY TaxID=3421652 RepID=UPI003D7C85CE
MKEIQRASAIMLLLIFLTGCASLAEEMEHPVEQSVTPLTSTLSELADTHRAQQRTPELSGVLLQETGWDALAQRLALIEQAEHYIDIQYYIWNGDISGRYLASRLIAAAERGVRVRVMLDDINLNERENLLAALDRHPRIDIRIFNPIPSRRGLVKWLNVLGDFSRLNRRMHNKSFTVDGVFSVVGGRNIGDEYFDLSGELNFRDRDVLVAGAVVSDIQASFVQYWGSRWSYPVHLLADDTVTELSGFNDVEVPQYRHQPDLPEGLEAAGHFLKDLMGEMSWVKARFVSDRPVPENADDTSKPKATARLLAELAHQAEQEILLESAYLIFDDRQLGELQQLADRGVVIKALTNSMASNDLITNHSGYAGRRRAMLAGGMQLFELKPDAILCNKTIRDPSRCAPTASYGLHAKSVVFDRKVACIGSFNLNLRSTYLNTESILVIENQAVSAKLADDIELAMHARNSWQLRLHDNQLYWYSGKESWTEEPETEQWQRIKSRFLQLFPIEKYL